MKRSVANVTIAVFTVVVLIFQIGTVGVYGQSEVNGQNQMVVSEGICTYDVDSGEEVYANPTNVNSRGTTDMSMISPEYNPNQENDIMDISASARSVIGTDERQRVNPQASPYCRVVYLRSYFPGGGNPSRGTGFILGPDLVMTAAHVLYSVELNCFASRIEVYTEVDGTYPTDPTTRATVMTIPTAYKNGGPADYDWAYFITADPIGYSQGWFGFGWGISSANVSISGYPATDPDGNYTYHMYSASGTFQRNEDNQLLANYYIDTSAGQSGAPLYDSDGIVWGVHSGGDKYAVGPNYGRLITKTLFDYLKSAKQEGIERWSS